METNTCRYSQGYWAWRPTTVGTHRGTGHRDRGYGYSGALGTHKQRVQDRDSEYGYSRGTGHTQRQRVRVLTWGVEPTSAGTHRSTGHRDRGYRTETASTGTHGVLDTHRDSGYGYSQWYWTHTETASTGTHGVLDTHRASEYWYSQGYWTQRLWVLTEVLG